MIGELINTVAIYIGYVFLGLLALACVGGLLTSRLDDRSTPTRRDSPESKQTLNHLFREEIGDASGRVRYEPDTIASMDWSMDEISYADLRELIHALESGGYTVHPYVSGTRSKYRTPEWSDMHAGIWKQEPAFTVEFEETEMEVTPDLDGHNWEVHSPNYDY